MSRIAEFTRLGGLCLAVLLTSCAVLPENAGLARFTPDTTIPAGADNNQCLRAFTDFDTRVQAAQAMDVQDQRIAGFPWYRINRPLAATAPTTVNDPAMPVWLAHLAALDHDARYHEARNAGLSVTSLLQILDDCRTDMMRQDLADPARRGLLLTRAKAGSVYNPVLRQAGLYALTSLGVARGYENWKADNLHVFDQPPAASLQGQDKLIYQPENAVPADQPTGFHRDAAGFPILTTDQQHALFQRYAPVVVVGHDGPHDRVGTMTLSETGEPVLDETRPVLYQRLSHTRARGKILPQLVYSFWFSARPKTGIFDILGGDLDGLILRVTLNEDLQPILYDSIHQCGCYHMAFPVPPWKRVAMAEDKDHREAILVPANMPPLAPDQRPVLWLASGSHYILGLTASDDLPDQSEDKSYSMADENDLRSLALPGGGYQSLFGPTGIIDKSSRLERFLLWPMGIENAGAMRQWGHHAIAFVGHRHFDDPAWFDQAFAPDQD